MRAYLFFLFVGAAAERVLHSSHEALLKHDGLPTLAFSALSPSKKLTGESSFFPAVVVGAIPPLLPLAEEQALETIYNGLNGNNWTKRYGWMSGSNPCGSPGWFGVTCTAFMNASHVTGLELPYNNLCGVLPPLAGLPYLKYMDVSNQLSSGNRRVKNNEVTGALSALCGLERLETILMACNMISGELPSCLGAMRNATVFDVAYNEISGTTPSALCNMVALEVLNVRGNRIGGTVPECLGDLIALQKIDYSNDNLDGSFPGLQSLEGTLPASLCRLPALAKLHFQHTQGLTGNLPECLGREQPALYGVAVQNNAFTGGLPEGLCDAKQLVYLYLCINQLDGTLPACLGTLSNLQRLELCVSNFHGTIPESLCGATKLVYLYLFENQLEGTLPACLGTLANLQLLELDTNGFHGTLPESFCGLSQLKFMELYHNRLQGTLPSCFGTAFPVLELMLLHDNRLCGPLPEVWNLPSLFSVVLSNNRGLNGPLPSGLFTEVVRTVVIEGTSIRGTIPQELCGATQIHTLALSGNRLEGSLPGCISALASITTVRVSHNDLSGKIAPGLSKLTVITTFDLSYNGFSGRVPAELGDLSHQLADLSLEQNDLSCDLPASVRHWKKMPAPNTTAFKFHVLKGNLFGCGGGALDLSMQDAKGLGQANQIDADAYSCGGADYVLPVSCVGVFVLPVVGALALQWWRGLLRPLGWTVCLSWRVNPSKQVEELRAAGSTLTRFGAGVAFAAVTSAAVVLALLQWPGVATSPYKCEYATRPTLANKGGNLEVLSSGIGAALSLGLVLGMVWWRPWLTPDSSPKPVGAQSSNDDDARSSKSAPDAQVVKAAAGATWLATTKAVLVVLGAVGVAAAPNVAYVLLILSDWSHAEKLSGEVGATLTKMLVSTLLVPKAARWAAHLLASGANQSFRRFQLRLALSTTLSALTTIVAPVAIVLVTDERCLYHAWHSPNTVTTDVPYEYCALISSTTGECSNYGSSMVQSSYTPVFDYDGSRCVAAALSAYAPVFLAAVLLSTTVPAALELLVVPAVAPWCHAKSVSNPTARRTLIGLRGVTFNVSPVLAAAASRAARVDPPPAEDLTPVSEVDVDHLAQLVVERGISQLMGTLLVALTFGVAAPAVGGACAVAALMTLVHGNHVLGTIVVCGIADRRVPDLKGCCFVPRACAAIVVATVLFVWGCACVEFLEPAFMAGAASATGLTCAGLWMGGTRVLRAQNDAKDAQKRAHRGRSSVWSVPSAGVLLMEEPLVGDGGGGEEGA